MAGRSDAATDRVSLASAPSTAALTIAGWARIDSAAGGSFNPVIRLSINAGDVSSWILGFKGTNGRTPSVYSPGNVTGISAPEMTLGTWVYLAATLNAGSAQLLYGTVPGVLSKVTGTVAASGTADQLCFFGRSAADGSEWLAGALAYQRIWAAVLSDAEIAAESQSAIAVRATNLFGHWSFAGAALTDTSGNGRTLTAGSTPLDAETDPVLDTGPAPLLITSGFHGPGPFGHHAPWSGTDRLVPTSATQAGDAALPGSGSLTAVADAAKPLDASLAANGTRTAAADAAKPAGAVLAATGAVTAVAVTDKPAGASLTGAGTLTAAATVDTAAQAAAATLTGTGTLAAAATTDKPIAGSLTGTLTVAGGAAAIKAVAAAAVGAGILSATATTTKPANASVAGTVAATGDATITKPSAAALTGVGSVTADAVVGAAPGIVGAVLSGTSTNTASAARIANPDASLAGGGSFIAVVSVVKQIDATLTAVAASAADTAKTSTVGATLAGALQAMAAATVPPPVIRGEMTTHNRAGPTMSTTDRAGPTLATNAHLGPTMTEVS